MGIIVAAVLIEVTAGVMYFTSQRIIQNTMERLVQTEMNAIYLCVRNKLIPVEVTIYNYAWVISGYLDQPEAIYEMSANLVEHNPSFHGSGVLFVPDYFPGQVRYFEPYAVRRADGSVKTLQLGNDSVDHSSDEYYRVPIAKNKPHWSEPYLDPDGASAVVTTFGVPVMDKACRRVAVAYADVTLDWLIKVVDEAKQYRSTQRFIISGAGSLLAGTESALFRQTLAEMQSIEEQQGHVVVEDEEGTKWQVFFHPIGGQTDWTLITIVDDDEVFGTLRTVRLGLIVLLLIGLVIMGFILHRAMRNMEQLQRVNTEKARIDTELKVANEIQQSMLPRGEVKDERLKVKGFLKPAREVGGDLYDYYVRDEKLFFCIGDVSGKGAASAMLMAVTHSLFRSVSAHETNPARIMTAINEASAEGNEKSMFVTLFIGVLDLPTGHLRYCNAGHDQPILIQHAASDIQHLECDSNLPVGVFKDTKFTMQEMMLTMGSTLFLYTDGLTEAKDMQRKQFGDRRMIAHLAQSRERSAEPQMLIEDITNAVHAFVGNAEQSDDLTMLAIYYTTAQFDSVLTETLTLTNNVSEVKRFSTFIKAVSEQLSIEPALAGQLRLAIEEAVVNIIDYAYPAGKKGQIDIIVQSDGKTLRVQIIDSGVPFDPTAKEKADTSLSAEDRQIGGLGILLVRELMDSINYERTNGKNVLTLVKSLNR